MPMNIIRTNSALFEFCPNLHGWYGWLSGLVGVMQFSETLM